MYLPHFQGCPLAGELSLESIGLVSLALFAYLGAGEVHLVNLEATSDESASQYHLLVETRLCATRASRSRREEINIKDCPNSKV